MMGALFLLLTGKNMFKQMISVALLMLLVCKANATEMLKVVADPLMEPAIYTSLAVSSVLLDVAMAGQRMIAVGERGHILYSDSQGESWQQAEVPVSVTLTAVDFATPKKGWAVGHGQVILTTEDGGLTWKKQMDGISLSKMWQSHLVEKEGTNDEILLKKYRRFAEEGADKPFLDVEFIDRRIGYVSGAYGVLLKTEDGGLSWRSVVDLLEHQEDRHIYDIEILGDEIFLAGEMGLVYHSENQGARFSSLASPTTASLFTVKATETQVVLMGLRGTLFVASKGSDHGFQWYQVAIPTEYSLVSAIQNGSRRSLILGDAGGGLWSLKLGIKPTVSGLTKNIPYPLASLLEGSDKQSLFAVGLAGVSKVQGGNSED